MGACLELQGNRWEVEGYLGEALAAWGGALSAYQRGAIPDHVVRNCDRVKQLIRNWFDNPRVFVSYARRDAARVKRVIAHLADVGAEVLWDQGAFPAGLDLSRLVEWAMGDLAQDDQAGVEQGVSLALRVAGVYLVMWSRTYATRPWTTFELTWAITYLERIRTQGMIGPRVVIVRLDEHPVPDEVATSLWIDLSRGCVRTRRLRSRARSGIPSCFVPESDRLPVQGASSMASTGRRQGGRAERVVFSPIRTPAGGKCGTSAS